MRSVPPARLALPTIVLALAAAAYAQSPHAIETDVARRCFADLRRASDDDGGRLWGRALAGPTMFFDADSGEAVANQRDADGVLAADGDLFRGRMPKDFAGANTDLVWHGVHWTVVLWPLPESPFARTALMLHESWHRIQSDLGLPSVNLTNPHLDGRDGRVWLLLEYRALRAALAAWGEERRRALADALAFRAYRHGLFPAAARDEQRMELHEGLAEFTGIALAGLDNQAARWHMAGRLKANERKRSLSRAFAYETGPAYGLLLDMHGDSWRHGLGPDANLPALLAAAQEPPLTVAAPELADVERRAAAYDGASLFATEDRREAERVARDAALTLDLVTGPVLVLPIAQGRFTFDPNAVVPLAGHGTVYLGCKFFDDWGVLTVAGAALVAADFATVTVPAPAAADANVGKGWQLDRADGFVLAPGPRAGDFVARHR